MVNLNNLELLQILPSSVSGDKNARAVAKALDPEIQSVSRDIREALIVSRIDELSEPVLDLLAWQWHVDFYEPDKLPVQLKRALVKNSIAWHRKKGTLWAVKQVLLDLGLEPEIREWFEIGTAPYTFSVEAKWKGDPARVNDFLGSDTDSLIRLAVEAAKPVRAGTAYVIILPDPPDIGLGEDHICAHDVCFWAHGLWPRPVIAVVPCVEGVHSSASFSRMSSVRRALFSLAPQFDEAKFGRWAALSMRCRSSSASRFRRRRNERDNRAVYVEKAFAQGFFDEGNCLGSLNCVYAPRYYHVAEAGNLDAAEWGAYVEPSGWRPIYRYFVKKIGLFLQILPPSVSDFITEVRFERKCGRGEPRESIIGLGILYVSTLRQPGRWRGEWRGEWRKEEPLDWKSTEAMMRNGMFSEAVLSLSLDSVYAPGERLMFTAASGAGSETVYAHRDERINKMRRVSERWRGEWRGKWRKEEPQNWKFTEAMMRSGMLSEAVLSLSLDSVYAPGERLMFTAASGAGSETVYAHRDERINKIRRVSERWRGKWRGEWRRPDIARTRGAMAECSD
ncbi:hypothetical protein FACS1894216_02700 [Synergistales bacterium]|nr:hypothetical protein FACS1894216_02700 [Synergistales bacterium]